MHLLDDDLVRLIGIDPSRVLMWTGAGVSVDAPTSLPPGNGLTWRALEHAFDRFPLGATVSAFRRAEMPGAFPRFETVLGVVEIVHHEAGLRYLLSDLVEAEPNALHEFFAAHITAGGRHLTANVDRALEHALNVESSDRVLHFHGAATANGQLEGLGIALDRIEDGFDDKMMGALDRFLLTPDIDAVIVSGYSGSDYFDVLPYLDKLAGGRALEGRRVLWSLHSGSTDLSEYAVTGQPAADEVLQTLRRAGAAVTVVSGDTRVLLAMVARCWGLPPVPAGRLPGVERWSPSGGGLSSEGKSRATAELLNRLGMPLHLLRWVHRSGWRTPPDFNDPLAQAHWEAGQFRRAATIWRACWDDTLDGESRREERLAACEWQRGQYERALTRLDRATRKVVDGSTPVEPTTRLVLADTLARVWDHASRFRDGRRWATEAIRAQALRMLPDENELRTFPPDLRDRAVAGRSKLGEDRALGLASDQAAAARHSQTSSISRTLAYEQGVLRDRGVATGRPCPADLRQFARRLRVIKPWSIGPYTLPGALEAFGGRALLRGLMDPRNDFTLRHRLRLLSAALSCAS